MPKPTLIQTVDVLKMGDRASVEVRVEAERAVLMLYMPGQQPRRYSFNAEQAERIGTALNTAAIRLTI